MTSKNELLAGIFVVAALVFLAASILVLGRERQIFAVQDSFSAVFQDVKGLAVGAPVRLGGISIGRVSKVGFSKDLADTNVHVDFLINDDYTQRIREDSVASIQTQGLLGDNFINISSGELLKQLSPGSTLKVDEGGDFGQLVSKATVVVDNTVEISKTLNEFLSKVKSEGDGSLNESIKSVANIAREIETGNGILHALIYDSTGKDSVKSLSNALASISQVTQNIDRIVNELESGNGLLHELIYKKQDSKIDAILRDLQSSATNLKNASDALASGSGTIGALLIDSRLYDNLVEVTDEARRSFLLRQAIRSSLDK